MGERGKLSGPLHIASGTDFGRQYVVDWVERFCAQHPAIVPTVSLSDRVDDVIAEGIDIAVRFGEPKESNAIVLPLCKNARRVLVASPAYWEKHGQPTHPRDLEGRACLVFSVRDTPYVNWRFWRGEHVETVTVNIARASNQSAVVSEWARRGLGPMYRSVLDVIADLTIGSLQTALDDWQGEVVPISLFRHGGHRQSPRVQAFASHARQEMEQLLRSISTQTSFKLE
jgi:DNA-binding transcriptional LysR family regulator